MEIKPFIYAIILSFCLFIAMILFGSSRYNSRDHEIAIAVQKQVDAAGGMITRQEFERNFKNLAVSLREDLKRQSEKQNIELQKEIEWRCKSCQQ